MAIITPDPKKVAAAEMEFELAVRTALAAGCSGPNLEGILINVLRESW